MNETAGMSQTSNRRKLDRRRQLKAGVIAMNNRSSTIGCTVRDLTDDGAKLKFEGSAVPLDAFVLLIEIDRSEYDCAVVWRGASELGVRFLAPPRKVSGGRVQIVAPVRHPGTGTLRKKPLQA
jgi:two-component system cell cycle response regulator